MPIGELIHDPAKNATPTVNWGDTNQFNDNHYNTQIETAQPVGACDATAPPSTAEKRPLVLLILYSSDPQCVGGEDKTGFSRIGTIITAAVALDFFRYDHTPICFKDSRSHGKNFKYAWAIPFDIDNSHSDNPEDWITPEAIQEKLEQLDINYWMCASRNHLLPKDGKAPRPKFHVYLPLSQPLCDSEKFKCFCQWCIRTFNSDKNVNKKSQKMFGYETQ